MKRYMLIGSSTCGKTTLIQRLNDMELSYKKTQSIELINSAIDTPGEYLENRKMYNAIMVTCADAHKLLFLQDATDDRFRFSPGQGYMFNIPVIGVVTKTDLATSEQIDNAKQLLTLAGVSKIFCTSAVTGEGVESLKQFLLD